MKAPLQLRDVHAGVAPAWWPLAPGWWILLAVLLVVIAVFAWLRWRRYRWHAAILRLFDDAVDQAGTPSQQIAAMSEVLRRAARRIDPGADRLEGNAWLRFLDEGLPQPVFTAGAGALLRDGGFRADIGDAQAAALRGIARERYLRWMQAK